MRRFEDKIIFISEVIWFLPKKYMLCRRNQELFKFVIFVAFCLLWGIFTTSVVRAETLGPGWFEVTADPVSPGDASNYYRKKSEEVVQPLSKGLFQIFGDKSIRARTLSSTLSSTMQSSAIEVTNEITELARDLQHDPKQIYEYVHNHIHYTPYFGSLKGAALTYLDGSGNDFDQASLMIALLRASGYTASYEYGTMFIPTQDAKNWVGIAGRYWGVLCKVFSYGGIPIDAASNNGYLSVSRVWVKANIDGKEYRFDPALKAYTDTPKIDIGQALGYNRSDLLAAVTSGATVTSNYVKNLNETALSNKLTQYSTNLVNTIRSQYPNSTVEEIIGSHDIVETSLTEYQTSLPVSTTLEASWNEIPPEYTTTLRIKHVGIDHTFDVPEIAGKRLTVTYAGGDHHPELRLDGKLVAQGTATTLNRAYELTLTVDHPYAAKDGTYCDQTSTYGMKSGATYALVSAYAEISDALINKRQKQLDSYRAEGLPETSEAVLGESLNVMGLTWLYEKQLGRSLAEDITDFKVIRHHSIGRMCQESSYYIDVASQMISFTHKFDLIVDSGPIHYLTGVIDSTLEHGILEQMMGSEIPGASTVKLLQVANSNGNKIFYADKSNFASISPQLKNYSVRLLGEFQSDLDNSNDAWFILPENADIRINQWHGLGYIRLLQTPQTRSLAWKISGDLYGGYGTKTGTVQSDKVVENNRESNPEAKVGIKQVHSQDPVNMATGAFAYDRTDLALGAKAPLGLAFSRSYSSSLNKMKKSLGYGWTHNYDIRLNQISHGNPGLGSRQPLDLASFITVLYASHDIYKNQDDVLSRMTVVLSAKWAIDQLINNAINVQLGSQVMEYIKLADGTYASPPGVTSKLIDNGNGTFSLKERFGSRRDFNANGRITKMTDVDGNVMTFTYNNGENLTRLTDTFGRYINLNYSGGRLSSISDSTGRTVSYSYDANDNLTSYTDSQGKVWSYGYDSEHRMKTLTNPLSITTTTNTYDSLGRVISQTTPRQGGATATYNFYFPGFRNIEKDPKGNETVYLYDEKGNSIGEENALGHRNLKKYDGQNHVIETIDPRGNRTIQFYDGNHNLISTINAQDKITNFTYDSQFRLTDIKNPLDYLTHMDYDSKHHLTLTRDAEGNEITSTYYPNGLTQTTTDGRRTTTTLTHDTNGSPKTSRVGSHQQVTYTYDAIGRMLKLTDQAGATTCFEYDNRGLPTKITDPLGKSTTFVYDAAGQLSSVTDRKGDTISYTYTPTGKVQSVTYPDSSVVNFTYDVLDNLIKMKDSIGTTIYTYDAANRLTSVTDPHGFVVSYAYDEAGNLTTLTYPGNKTVSYNYNALNKLQTVTNWLGQTATYTYDDAGLLIKLVNFNGTVTTYDYDKADWLIALENQKNDGSFISTYHFTLDGNGNRTEVDQNEPLVPNFSTQTTDYSYNTERNHLQTAGPLNFTWDREGQLSTMDGANFSFDSKHRLSSVTGPSTLQYAYDGGDQRLQAMRDGITTRYVYDAAGSLLAEANASNEITRYYIHGIGLLAMVTPANESYCYHYNAIGSTIAITDASQAISNMYTYTPFGEISNQIETVPQTFKFVGRHGVMTEPNGLYYMRARYYDPAVGRFISEDPLGFEGGDVNLYAYVLNNPIGFIDPWGKCRVDETASFRWWDGTSWLFLGTNYCGATKSGPGPTTSEIDKACKQHDESLRQSGAKWWQIWNKNVQNAHKELIGNWREAMFNSVLKQYLRMFLNNSD